MMAKDPLLRAWETAQVFFDELIAGERRLEDFDQFLTVSLGVGLAEVPNSHVMLGTFWFIAWYSLYERFCDRWPDAIEEALVDTKTTGAITQREAMTFALKIREALVAVMAEVG
jgi:hypothetical protein